MNVDITLQDFIDFLRNELGQVDLPISNSTQIAVELGVAGDDGEDLIIAIHKKYKVDVSRFNLNNYFGSEPAFWSLNHETLKPLSVGDLLGQIQRGYLE